MRIYIIWIFIHISILYVLHDPLYAQDSETISFIGNALIKKGVAKDQAHKLLNDPRVYIDNKVIIKNLFQRLPKVESYNKYIDIEPQYIDMGKQYIKDNSKEFKKIYDSFAVSPQIITAILIIETRLGRYPEKYNVFRSYISLAACGNPAFFESLKKDYITQYPELSDNATSKRARSKASWALDELYYLIVLAENLNIDPLEIMGSFAGAIGPAQFIPSSFIKYGIDGDNDGKKDPFNETDVIASIANYLKLAGWREDAPLEKKRKAIWHYNHSDIYVNTAIMLCTKLSKDTFGNEEISKRH